MTQEEIELIRDRVLYALKGFVSIGKLENQTMINILDSILKPYTKLYRQQRFTFHSEAYLQA